MTDFTKPSKPDTKRYRTTNWSDYNAALKSRGSLTVWLDEGMKWYAPIVDGKNGRPARFSDAAIVLSEHQMSVQFTLVPNHRLGAKSTGAVWAEVGSARLKHCQPQTKKPDRAIELHCQSY
jgi:hypothetical protein